MNDALTRVTSDQLRTLYRQVYRGELECPFDRRALLCRGLNPQAEACDILFGLGEQGVRAVIASVLAERERHG